MGLDSLIFFLAFIPFLLLFYYSSTMRWRKTFILAMSAFCLAYVNVDYLIIAICFALFNYFLALSISNTEAEHKKRLTYLIGIILNILGLAVFKYADFISLNLNELLFGGEKRIPYLDILLPLGISYYTFQSISYLFDVYHENDDAEEDLADFMIYLLFFPKFIAGPIERAYNFLPQLKNEEAEFNTESFRSGMRLFLWGLFKKVVVASAMWKLISPVYADLDAFHGISLILVACIYPFQIYAEFSGYTDMALGASRMIGINLSPNFNAPFSATSISEFWRRWHISLSTWVSDYIYTPLSMKIALSKDWGKMGIVLAIATSFIVLGIWHGAQWTYIFFGALQALFISYEILTRKRRNAWRKACNVKIYDRISNVITISVYAFSCIFFGVKTMPEGFQFVTQMFSGIQSSVMAAIQNIDLARMHILYLGADLIVLLKAIGLFTAFMMIQSWIDKKGLDQQLESRPVYVRWAFYYAAAGMIFFHSEEAISFLYGTF